MLGLTDSFVHSLRHFQDANQQKQDQWFIGESSHVRDVRHYLLNCMEGINMDYVSSYGTAPQYYFETLIKPSINMKASEDECRESEAVALRFLNRKDGSFLVTFLTEKIVNVHCSYLSENVDCHCKLTRPDVKDIDEFLASLMIDLVGSKRPKKNEHARKLIPFHKDCLIKAIREGVNQFIKRHLAKTMMYTNGIINSGRRLFSELYMVLAEVRSPNFVYDYGQEFSRYEPYKRHPNIYAGKRWVVKNKSNVLSLESAGVVIETPELVKLAAAARLPDSFVSFDLPKKLLLDQISDALRQQLAPKIQENKKQNDDEKKKKQEEVEKKITKPFQERGLNFSKKFLLGLDESERELVLTSFTTTTTHPHISTLWNFAVIRQQIGNIVCLEGSYTSLLDEGVIISYNAEIDGIYIPGLAVTIVSKKKKKKMIFRPGFSVLTNINMAISLVGPYFTLIDGGGLVMMNMSFSVDFVSLSQIIPVFGLWHAYMFSIVLDVSQRQ